MVVECSLVVHVPVVQTSTGTMPTYRTNYLKTSRTNEEDYDNGATSYRRCDIEILKDMYTNSSVTVHMHKESEKIRIKRGVKQGDTISPKLFTATLESIFRRLNWENKSVKIDGEFLSNLRLADDIFLCTETPQKLQQML